MIEDHDLELINRKIKGWLTNHLFTTAIVDSVDSNGCSVIFAGESTPTQKRYKRLEDTTLAQGDRVLMLRMGTTFLILGKIV